MRRDRLVRYAAIGAGALVVIAVGVAAFISLESPFQPATSTPLSAPCSPKPCANIRGFILWVSDVKVDSAFVSMSLTFRNSSNATHADPADLQLVESSGRRDHAVHDAPGCAEWPRTQFNNGAQLGPVPECFRPSSASSPLKLHWTPDFGFLCCETDITLVA